MIWIKKSYRRAKAWWNRNLRPVAEPVIKALVVKKTREELERWKK